MPLVSVLITAYNRENYIAESIQSVLSSTFKDFEMIIVDDCSTDRTVEIAKSFEIHDSRIKVYSNETNLGDYPNRNKAASYATGKYIKYLDSDDVMYSHCLQVMVSAMEQFPEAGYGLSAIGDPNTPYPVAISPKQAYLEHFSGYGHFDRAPGSAIIRKSAFDGLGGFKSKKYIGDTEMWFLLSQKNYLVKLQRDLVWDRIHPNTEKVYESKERRSKEKRNHMINSFLTHSNCPLIQSEIDIVLKNIRKKTKKNIFRKWLSILIEKIFR